jgi:O-antigen/teichoic acid export membrane protein
MGVTGIFAAQLIINIVFGLVAIAYLKNYSSFSFSRSLSKKLLMFGLPIIPYSVFLWVESASSRILLEKFAGLREVGLFAVAFQFAGILKILTNHLDNALLPNFYELAEKENRELAIGRFQLKYFFFITSFALALLFISEPLLLFTVDKKYHEAVIYLPWLIFALWISDLTKIFKWNLLSANKSNTVSVLQTLSTFLTVTLFILLLSFYNGVIGIVFAMCITFSIMLFIYYFASQKVQKIPLQPLKILLILTTLIIPYAISYFIGFLGNKYLSSVTGIIFLLIAAHFLMIYLGLGSIKGTSFFKLKLFDKRQEFK